MNAITTVAELDALPVGSVVRSEAGSIGCRYDGTRGVVFGADVAFPWHNLALPCTVLYRPDQQPTAQPSDVLAEVERRLQEPNAEDARRFALLHIEAWREGRAHPPTAQPTVEQVAFALYGYDWEDIGGATHQARAVLALSPGRPESIVKAEALRDATADLAAAHDEFLQAFPDAGEQAKGIARAAVWLSVRASRIESGR